MGRLSGRIRLILMPLLFFATLIIIWEIAVNMFNIRSFMLPKPSEIGAILILKADMFLKHSLITIYEALGGLAVGTIAGFAAAVGLFFFKPLRDTVYPLLISLNTLPKSAIAPLLILWFGAGIFANFLVVTLITFFPILINTMAGLESINPELVELARSLKATRTQIFNKIRLPACLPHFFAGFKIAVTLSLVGAVVAEFIISEAGLGYLAIVSLSTLNTPQIFGVVVVLSVIGLAFYGSVELLEKKVIFWRGR